MKPIALPLLAAFGGLALIATSLVWSGPLGPTPKWTEEQAKTLAAAGAEYHRLAHEREHDHSGSNSKASSEKDDAAHAAQQRWKRQGEQLASAKSRHQLKARVMKWSGIALAAAGVIGFLLLNRDGS